MYTVFVTDETEMKKINKIISFISIIILLIVVIPTAQSTTKITSSKGNSWSATGSNIQLATNDLGPSGGTVYLPSASLSVPAINIPYNKPKS